MLSTKHLYNIQIGWARNMCKKKIIDGARHEWDKSYCWTCPSKWAIADARVLLVNGDLAECLIPTQKSYHYCARERCKINEVWSDNMMKFFMCDAISSHGVFGHILWNMQWYCMPYETFPQTQDLNNLFLDLSLLQ